MFNKKSNRMHDERIEKESNKPAALMFYVTTVCLVLLLGAKIVCQVPVYVYALEMGCLAISIIYAVANKAINGILFMKEKDDVLTTLNNKILSKAYMIDFWLLAFGEVVFIVVLKDYFWWVAGYLATLLFPALVITIFSIKNGWLVWGSKKQEKTGIKEFRKRVVIGSIFFGLFVGFPHLYRNNAFHPEGLIWVAGLGVAWGVMFYFMFLGMMKWSEKKADKRAEDADNAEEVESEVDNIEE